MRLRFPFYEYISEIITCGSLGCFITVRPLYGAEISIVFFLKKNSICRDQYSK